MKVVVIIPTYNERENIVELLEKLDSVRAQLKHYTIVLLVVDDNSPDGTQERVRQFAQSHKDVFLLTGRKEGLGRALLRGMKYAVETFGADTLVQIDADLSHDPNKLPEFLKKISEGADFAVGSRYIPGGSIPANWGIHRKIYSVVGNAIVRFGLGHPEIHDWTGGYRAFRKIYYERAKERVARYSGYVFQIAFLHNAVVSGAKVREVPIHFTDRRFGRSKIAPLHYILNIYLYIISTRLKEIVRMQFFKFAAVGTIGFVINTIVLELFVRVGWHPAAASALGAEVAIVSNFFLNNSWTFRHSKIRGIKMVPKFIQFNLTSVGAIVIQAGTVAMGSWVFGVQRYRIFYIIGVGLGLIWNYIMYSLVIWKKHHAHTK